jgi:hypothetical protein
MTSQFDASLVHDDPISEDILAEQRKAVEHWVRMPSALANAKLHAENELQRLVLACNRLVWKAMPAETRKPTPQEVAQLMEHLSAEDRERLKRDAKLATEQRHLVGQLAEVENAYLIRQQAEEAENAEREAMRLEIEEFEAYDAAEKQKRFEAWRASRRR